MRLWIADEIKINRKKIINKNILKIKVPSENISDLCCRVLCVQSSLRNLNSLWPDRKQALSAWEGKHHYMPGQKQTRVKCFSSPEPSQGKATWCLLITQEEFGGNTANLKNNLFNLCLMVAVTQKWSLFLSAWSTRQSSQEHSIAKGGSLLLLLSNNGSIRLRLWRKRWVVNCAVIFKEQAHEAT